MTTGYGTATASVLRGLLEVGAPEHAALRVPGGPTVTYDALRRQVDRLSAHLRGLGVRREDRVAMVLPNSLEALVAFLAVSNVATAAPLNPAYKEDEFRFYMEDTGARSLVLPSEGAEAAEQAASDSVLRIAVVADDSGEVSFSPGAAAAGDPGPGPDPDDVALVLHTSGTTSRPKRVPLTHANLIASVGNIVDTYGLTPEDVSLCIMPLFHVHGLVASVLSTFGSGGAVVLPPRFNALGFWPVVREHNVSWFSAVPSMHQALVARARRREEAEAGTTGRLRFIRSCSSSLAPATMLEMEERFGVPVLEAYGMTEAAHQMASNPLPPDVRLPGTVGAGTGVQIGVMDEGGALLATGDRGEVVIRGSNVIRAYESNPEANASSFTDGWFRTGDEGVLDAQGYLTLTGRIKELINRSGEKVSPREIDEVLMAHPAVAEAVAFAVPHPTHGEEPGVAVVLSEAVPERDLLAHCRAHLADFKCPRKVYIVDSLPRTATGKIQRRIVAAAVLGDTGSA